MFKQFLKSLIVRILTAEARLVLRKYRPRIIAVTGTVGKTTTKDALYAMLSEFLFVRKSEKSFNTDIGVPLTILGLPNGWNNPFIWLANIVKGFFLAFPARTTHRALRYPDWLVLEVGADAPGDIKTVARWLSPDVVVVTRLAKVPVHVEFFPSVEALFEEKAALVEALRENGLLVLNGDDADTLAMKDRARGRRLLICGVKEAAAVSGSHYEVVYENRERGFPTGVSFRVNALGSFVPVRIPGALGKQLMQPILAACAVGVGEGFNLVRIAGAFRRFLPPPGRMRLVSGKRETCIIDDTYNASPVALAEALEALQGLRTVGRKIAVLGDMLELGRYSAGEHEKAGRTAASSCDFLVTVGVRGRQIAAGARAAGMSEKQILTVENSKEAGLALQEILAPGDAVLVKGSQRMRMEKIVSACMAEPERAKELLARQEKEWELRE